MYFKNTTIVVFFLLFLGCEEKPIELNFDTAIPIFSEPASVYCDYDSYVELEGEEFGAIRTSYRSADGKSIVFYFQNRYDELSLYYDGLPNGFKSITQDTVINFKENNKVALYFKFYGSSSISVKDGNFYCKVLPNNRLKVTWCNLQVEEYVGHRISSKGSFIY